MRELNNSILRLTDSEALPPPPTPPRVCELVYPRIQIFTYGSQVAADTQTNGVVKIAFTLARHMIFEHDYGIISGKLYIKM